MLFYGIVPGIAMLALPLLFLLAAVTALGIGLWLSALNVKYRDIGYIGLLRDTNRIVKSYMHCWIMISVGSSMMAS